MHGGCEGEASRRPLAPTAPACRPGAGPGQARGGAREDRRHPGPAGRRGGDENAGDELPCPGGAALSLTPRAHPPLPAHPRDGRRPPRVSARQASGAGEGLWPRGVSRCGLGPPATCRGPGPPLPAPRRLPGLRRRRAPGRSLGPPWRVVQVPPRAASPQDARRAPPARRAPRAWGPHLRARARPRLKRPLGPGRRGRPAGARSPRRASRGRAAFRVPWRKALRLNCAQLARRVCFLFVFFPNTCRGWGGGCCPGVSKPRRN